MVMEIMVSWDSVEKRGQKNVAGRIRTCAGYPNRFLVYRLNHSATATYSNLTSCFHLNYRHYDQNIHKLLPRKTSCLTTHPPPQISPIKPKKYSLGQQSYPTVVHISSISLICLLSFWYTRSIIIVIVSSWLHHTHF